jgi:hypothetical protein
VDGEFRARGGRTAYPTAFALLNPTHRPAVASAVTLSLRSRWSKRAERRWMFRRSPQSSEASLETINAWIVPSQANAPELTCRRIQ